MYTVEILRDNKPKGFPITSISEGFFPQKGDYINLTITTFRFDKEINVMHRDNERLINVLVTGRILHYKDNGDYVLQLQVDNS